MHNEAYTNDLGPFAYALQTIVRNLSKNRPGTDSRVKFWSYMGATLLDAQIADIKELEGTKKEKALTMNLMGFNTCYDRKQAQDKAFEHVEKSTNPTIFEIVYTRQEDYLRLNLA